VRRAEKRQEKGTGVIKAGNTSAGHARFLWEHYTVAPDSGKTFLVLVHRYPLREADLHLGVAPRASSMRTLAN
jgi:hypothetical protein